VKTLERKKLWNMQTPQTIELELAKKAFGQAREEKFIGTDDVSLVERLGESVKIIEGSEFNFKITTPIDLELAKIILKNRLG
jgi:2-C-methyl-D-erythritol 4-phosphate cytidylyltransferase